MSESLPVNVGKPTLGPQSSILGEMLIVGLTADSTSMLDLRTIADWTIRPRLLSTGGVAQVLSLIHIYYSTPTYGGGFYTLTPIMYPMKGTTAYTPYYTIFDPKLKPQNTRSYEVGSGYSSFPYYKLLDIQPNLRKIARN